MGKGKRSLSINSFSRSLLDNGLLSTQKLEALPSVLSTTSKTVGSIHLPNNSHCRWKTTSRKSYKEFQQTMEPAPFNIVIVTYLNILLLILFGHLRDFFGKICKPKAYAHLMLQNGMAPLLSDYDSFYTRRMYMRIRDCWNRPITGVAGRQVHLLERYSPDYNKTFKISSVFGRLTGKVTENLNFSSYNYLGFAQSSGPCADDVELSTRQNGISHCNPRAESGTSELHLELERTVARFVGKEAAMVVSMGFATNSTTIPALVNEGCLVISDELNHSSIIFGVRLSGATVKTFKHNDMNHLRDVLKQAISKGQPRTHRRWKKILVIVEGIYSMEATIVNLPELIELKKKYKFYLYVDEAHSIGALGEHGGGVCDFYHIDPAEVDILMGTFTKSFGSAGGYIAADKKIIDHLKLHNHAYNYAEPMSVPVTQQVITSMKIVAGEDGTSEGAKRIEQLARNSAYFSARLREMGFIVYGDKGSPVVPLLLFQPAKIPLFSRELLKRGIAIVVVGYPATPIAEARARFCISAAHTKKDLDFALEAISEVGDQIYLKMKKPQASKSTY
ncbi:pyridoxal phosphate-dependent transferase [Gilbertella persicaria]|uniref:pyridoxal phosphate-dependent transferase n=1 Tax=Gilbertella persicaria TaxID=101096 RepID=UPI0022209A74|nr:pyridoxal phosphate-dependent transferase [Gilbertella persicaria]KAI8072173.1 pyridoxal phosphate-dependent transferase [Gilbertella persicaria]